MVVDGIHMILLQLKELILRLPQKVILYLLFIYYSRLLTGMPRYVSGSKSNLRWCCSLSVRWGWITLPISRAHPSTIYWWSAFSHSARSVTIGDSKAAAALCRRWHGYFIDCVSTFRITCFQVELVLTISVHAYFISKVSEISYSPALTFSACRQNQNMTEG